MELPEGADNSLRIASEKQHGMESKNACNCPIFDTFGRYIWKLELQEASIQEHQNWNLECEGSVLSMEVPTHFR